MTLPCLRLSTRKKQNACIDTKIRICLIARNLSAFFVIFSENMLDKIGHLCYIILAREWKETRTAMMREIAS